MRRLRLGPTDTALFQALWEGWAAAKLPVRGLVQLKTALDIHNALEAISTLESPGARVLNQAGGELFLEESQWELLKDICNSVEWRPSAAAQAVALLTWLSNAELVT